MGVYGCCVLDYVARVSAGEEECGINYVCVSRQGAKINDPRLCEVFLLV